MWRLEGSCSLSFYWLESDVFVMAQYVAAQSRLSYGSFGWLYYKLDYVLKDGVMG